jgi:NADPH:quinone reductase-like Zn-dependent oxidoreductase
MLRQSLDLAKIKPLGKELWAGAVDNLGGDYLAWMASTMKVGGAIASIGLAASMSLNTTVMPFILRGVSAARESILAIVGWPGAAEVWQHLATDMKPRHLAPMTHGSFGGLCRPAGRLRRLHPGARQGARRRQYRQLRNQAPLHLTSRPQVTTSEDRHG